MDSFGPTISVLLLQRVLRQGATSNNPGLEWGISNRRYLGSFTPALTRESLSICADREQGRVSFDNSSISAGNRWRNRAKRHAMGKPRYRLGHHILC
jgi:hypothetical protein